MSVPISAVERVKKLKAVIDDLRYRYHVLDDPSVTDAQYDSLMRELIELETAYPALRSADSPSQRVGGQPLAKFAQIRHEFPMLSLNDAFDEVELRQWESRLKKLVPYTRFDYYCELKIDGLAISIVYHDGQLRHAATRGDGLVGEDVTANVKTIHAVPLSLRKTAKTAPVIAGRLEVRGEVYMPKKSFDALNQARQQAGLPLFANPRNAAAGSLRQLDAKITASRDLSFTAYQIIGAPKLTQHHQEHELALELGFASDKRNKLCRTLDEVIGHWRWLEKQRDRLPYQVDGVVVGIDNTAIKTKLGVAGKSPRGMIAFKWPAQEATSVIEEIIVQVGRTGALTPVARLKPVVVAGSTVSRASLHNQDEITKKDIRVGDTVIVRKAGDVIPEIVGVITKLRPKTAKPYRLPNRCPVCHTPVVRSDSSTSAPGAIVRCPNPDCFAAQRRALHHFVGKGAFEMDGLGPKILDRFIEEGFITSFDDIFELTVGDIRGLERFGEVSAQKIVDTIHNRTKISLARFLFALGIRGVGEQIARAMADYIANVTLAGHRSPSSREIIDAVVAISPDEWQSVPDIGPVVARHIADYFRRPDRIEFLRRLIHKGVTVIASETTVHRPNITGKSFVFTGTLATLSREDAKNRVRHFGGEASETVSKLTDYLVAGENPGSKLAKATALGVKVITEGQFTDMLR